MVNNILISKIFQQHQWPDTETHLIIWALALFGNKDRTKSTDIDMLIRFKDVRTLNDFWWKGHEDNTIFFNAMWNKLSNCNIRTKIIQDAIKDSKYNKDV